MIILPFIENAFKHGKVKPESIILIRLEVASDKIDFTVKNKTSKYKKKDDVGGIGIKT